MPSRSSLGVVTLLACAFSHVSSHFYNITLVLALALAVTVTVTATVTVTRLQSSHRHSKESHYTNFDHSAATIVSKQVDEYRLASFLFHSFALDHRQFWNRQPPSPSAHEINSCHHAFGLSRVSPLEHLLVVLQYPQPGSDRPTLSLIDQSSAFRLWSGSPGSIHSLQHG